MTVSSSLFAVFPDGADGGGPVRFSENRAARHKDLRPRLCAQRSRIRVHAAVHLQKAQGQASSRSARTCRSFGS